MHKKAKSVYDWQILLGTEQQQLAKLYIIFFLIILTSHQRSAHTCTRVPARSIEIQLAMNKFKQ